MSLLEIEQTALDLLLAGDESDLEALRGQLSAATVLSRKFTGVGFFTTFAVDPDAPKASRGLILSDVMGEVTGLEHDAGFVLFARDGVVDVLECYIVDDAWPDNAKLLRAYYVHPEEPGSSRVVQTPRRDLEWALRKPLVSGQ